MRHTRHGLDACRAAGDRRGEVRRQRVVERRERGRIGLVRDAGLRQQLGDDAWIGLAVGAHAPQRHVDAEDVAHRQIERHVTRSVPRVQDGAVEIEQQKLHPPALRCRIGRR